MGKQYKAAIYQDQGRIDIVTKELPDAPADDEVIVKNLIATICGADFASYTHGDGDKHMLWSGYEFGHEMVSEVIAVGKDVKDVEVGEWIFPNLGYAYQDHHRMATVGGFSEYLVLPKFSMDGSCQAGSPKQPSAIRLDKSLGLENLVLLEPFSVGTKAAASLNPAGKTAIVIGAGIIGLSTAVMLKYYGAEKVMILDFSEFRLKNAREYGILTCNPSKENLDEVLFDTFGETYAYGGKKCGANIFVDCIGIQPAIDYFTKYAGFAATLAIVGTHDKKDPTIPANNVCFNQQHICGCGMQALDKCFDDICDLIRSGTDLSKLITHKIPLEKIEEGMEALKDAESSQKVAVIYE